MDHSKQERIGNRRLRDAVGGGGQGGSAAGPAAASYLEQDGNTVTEQLKEWIEVRSCGCKSRFCPHCCLPLGLALKRRLLPELAKFTGLMMLTFTIDPQLFASPAEAYEYVTKHRCISVTMQRLHRWGFLHSRRYVCVVEWQKETEQAHWHVLVDASRIPFDKLCEAWNRNWKQWKQRVALGRPGFGSVRFTVSQFKESGKAAGYVTAYLTKHPQHGYPSWVLDKFTREVHRFSASRGFWSDGGGDDEYAGGADDPSSVDDPASGDDQEQEQEDERRRTVRQQLESCGKSCAVLHVRQELDETTGELVERRTFEFLMPATTLTEVLELLPVLHPSVNARKTSAAYVGAEALAAREILAAWRKTC